MTALFVIIFIDQWEKADTHKPALAGLAVGIISLLIFGENQFMLPALIIVSIFGILAVLVLINKMWLQLGILALIYGAMMVVLFAAAEVQVWIDVATDLLRDV